MKNSDAYTTIKDLRTKIEKFVKDREWEKYHNPKDLAESICIEAAELLEIFQWMSVEEALSLRENPTELDRVTEELADILIYCLSMTNAMEIEVSSIVAEKLARNGIKYSVEKYKGRARLR